MDEIGWTSSAPMGGVIPLTWQDIQAWMNVTNTQIDVDDVLTMRHLSQIYVSSYYEGENQNTPAPYVNDELARSEENANAVSDALKAWANSFPKR